MILEVAILNVIAEKTSEFEESFETAKKIIAKQNGFVSLSLQKCLEKPSRYILLVNWKTLEDHTKGFRGSSDYHDWKNLLHHFYDPFPVVEHYELPISTFTGD